MLKKSKSKISAVVLTKNEELTLGRCLNSLHFCDEIIVLDDYSTDKTSSVAKRHGAKVIKRKLDSDFAAQRNYGLKIAVNEWVLFIDADEIVTRGLATEITRCAKNFKADGFRIQRLDVLWGKTLKHGELGKFGKFGNSYHLRLGRKNAGIWKRKIHETWNIKGGVKKLNGHFLHYPHQNLYEFLDHLRFQSDLHAHELLREGKSVSIAKIIAWPVGKFIYNYIIKLGFLDGVRGFILALLMSFHSFLAWSSLWLSRNSKK